ncbi:MAG: hypothetical protein R6W99_00915, partial [Clostridia bacterium]
MKRLFYILMLVVFLTGICSFASASTVDMQKVLDDYHRSNAIDMERALEDYYRLHESRPHIPSPSRQADVAVGVGITTVGIVILNSLTNTTLFGSAPFNSTAARAQPRLRREELADLAHLAEVAGRVGPRPAHD